jgi:hypothetical protein
MKFEKLAEYAGKCGVYQITNMATGDSYIGKTKDFAQRYREHSLTLTNARIPGKTVYGNVRLAHAATIYPDEVFEFKVLAHTPNYAVASSIESQMLRPHVKPTYNVMDDSISHLENSSAIKVLQYSPEGYLLKIFSSVAEAAREIKVHSCNILGILDGTSRAKSSGGFYWKPYEEPPPMVIEPPGMGSRISVEKARFWKEETYTIDEWDWQGRHLRSFTDVDTAVEAIGVHRSCFNAHLRGDYHSIHGKIYTLNGQSPDLHDNKRNQAVRRFSTEGELLEVHPTVRQAATQFNADVSTIREAIRLKRKTNYAIGYIWAYDDGSEVTPILLARRGKYYGRRKEKNEQPESN